jgi:isopenicillin-N epimerase
MPDTPRAAWPAPAKLWSLDPSTLHLNHGSFGAVPRAALDAQARFRASMEANPTRFFWRELPAGMDEVHAETAAFVGADPQRFALMPNVSAAIAAVLATVRLGPDDEALISDDTYPGVRAAVEQACQSAGALTTVARLSSTEWSGEDYRRAVLEAVTPRTRLAVIDHVTAMSAVEVDVARLSDELHAAGVSVAVDGAHAPGALPVDVERTGADYYAGSFHKWCCAPRGAAFLAWGPRADPPRAAVVGSLAAAGLPASLEWWGTGDYTAMLAVPTALRFLSEYQWPRLRFGNAHLVQAGARLVADALRSRPPGASRLPMAAVPLPEPLQSADPVALRLVLLDHGVEVSVAPARGTLCLRISAHLYSSLDDFRRLVAVLDGLGWTGAG